MSGPITIEEVRQWLPELQAKTFKVPHRIALLTISQAETIKAQGEETAKLKQERDEAYEMAVRLRSALTIAVRDFESMKDGGGIDYLMKASASAVNALISNPDRPA